MTQKTYFIGLILLNVFTIGCTGSAVMYLPLFYRQILGFDNKRIGFITAITPFTSIIGSPFWASIVDRTGADKKVMIGNMLIAMLSTLSISLIPHLSQSLFGRTALVSLASLVTSFFGSSIVGLMDAVILRVLADRKTLFGRQKIGYPIGFALSTFGTGLLIKTLDSLYALFIVSAISSLSFIITVMLTSFEPYTAAYQEITNSDDKVRGYTLLPTTPSHVEIGGQSSHEVQILGEEGDETKALLSRQSALEPVLANSAEDSEKATSIWQLLESPDALQFYAYMVLSGFSMSIVIFFLFLFFEHDLHASPILIGSLGPLGSTVELICFLCSKKIFRSLGGSGMIIAAQCLIIIRCLVYILCRNFSFGVYLAMAAQLLHGVGFSMVLSAAALQADHLAPPHLKSSVQGLLYMAMNGIGGGLGALLGGVIYDQFGASIMFALNAIIAAASVFIYRSRLLRRIIFVPLAEAINSRQGKQNK